MVGVGFLLLTISKDLGSRDAIASALKTIQTGRDDTPAGPGLYDYPKLILSWDSYSLQRMISQKL